MRAFLLLLAPLLCFGQIRLYTIPGPGVEVPVESSLDLGVTPAGDTLDTTFRLRNHGMAAVTLVRLRAAGTGFSVRNYPPLPHIMAPGTNVDFTVRFLPAGPGSYSANLQVNDDFTLLRATSPAGLTILLDHDGVRTVLSTDTPVDFGRFERGGTASRTFVLCNGTNTPQGVDSITVNGPHFQGPEGIAVPVLLAPGESAAFMVALRPSRSGVLQSQLRIDKRTFLLEAFVQEPPFPRPEIVVPADTASGRHGKLQVRLGEASRARGSGTLTMTFTPAAAGLADPAVMFLASGSRIQSISVNEGDSFATVQGSPDIAIQTGTTAGTLAFRLELGAHTHEAAVNLAQIPVGIDSAAGTRITNGLELKLTGFDNTRSAGEMVFTFYDPAGRVIGAPVRADAAAIFRDYFNTATLGGIFALQAIFPVAGNSADIATMEIEIRNAAGTAKSERVQFR